MNNEKGTLVLVLLSMYIKVIYFYIFHCMINVSGTCQSMQKSLIWSYMVSQNISYNKAFINVNTISIKYYVLVTCQDPLFILERWTKTLPRSVTMLTHIWGRYEIRSWSSKGYPRSSAWFGSTTFECMYLVLILMLILAKLCSLYWCSSQIIRMQIFVCRQTRA